MAEALQPRVVVVTGGSSGIGLGSAALFAAKGWRVGLISRSEERLAKAADLIAHRMPDATVTWAVADVSDHNALAAAARRIAATLGPISVWVNAAGNGVYGHFADVSEDEFRRVTDVTYLGTVNGTRVALSHMRPRDEGTIVNVCSAVVFHGVPLMTSYSGAKAAVRAFGQSLRLELRLAGSHVRLGTLFPPAINTPFFDHAVSHMGFPSRPVPPVYGTRVAAQGVYFCATGGGGEMLLTGVVIAYSLIVRVSLRLAGFLVSKSDFASEMPRDDPGSTRRPSLFTPAGSRCAMDGGFGSQARNWSNHLKLISAWRMLRASMVPGQGLRAPRPVARSQRAPGCIEADRPSAGLALPEPAASDSAR